MDDLISGQQESSPDPKEEYISRQQAMEAIDKVFAKSLAKQRALDVLESVPAAPVITDEAKKALLTWLITYQVETLDVRGKYKPFEVLSWVINDWRKEHDKD